jgi:hypothetical protein
LRQAKYRVDIPRVMFLPVRIGALPQHGGLAIAAAAIFAAGLTLGAVIGPGVLGRGARTNGSRPSPRAMPWRACWAKVGITNVAQDKYGSRVDADASAAGTPNVADAMLAQGLARHYDGGKRASWRDAQR